jgi:hypothetical protein
MNLSDETASIPGGAPDVATRVYRWIAILVAVVMTLDLGFVLYAGHWLTAFLIVTIMGVILAPTLLGDRLPVRIPAEFQALTLLFIFASLFLGEIRRYYDRFWWWDLALHASSSLLLGVLGFLLVYVLNESRRIEQHMRPHFVALFAFLFSLSVGTLWELFEFAMDEAFGLNMQKPTPGDPSGLTDTMWDLLVDVVSALAISIYGWWYMVDPAQSFIERWIDKFIAGNPRLFRSRGAMSRR